MPRSRMVLAAAATLALVAGLTAPLQLAASSPAPPTAPPTLPPTSAFVGIAYATASCHPIVYRFASDDPNKPTEHTGIEAVEPTPCRQWEVTMPEGRRAWQYQNQKTYTAETSTGEEVSLDFAGSTTFAADLDPSGAFRSLTITIDVASGATTAGEANIGQDYDLRFTARAPALVISGSGSIEGDGDELAGSGVAVGVYLECYGTPDPAANRKYEFNLFGFGGLDYNGPGDVRHMSDSGALDGRISTGAGGCTMRVKASVHSKFYNEGEDDHATKGHATLTLTLTADAGPCDLGGIVRDGKMSQDGHDSVMPGIPVELYRDDSPVGPVSVTDRTGHYCLVGVQPDDYQLRATLEDDATAQQTLFWTRIAGQDDVVSTEREVSAGDLGSDDLDIDFSATAEKPWLADVANIHWQTWRFVDWLVGTLGLDPAQLSSFAVSTLESGGTRYEPDPERMIVVIDAEDTGFARRHTPLDDGPENGEWHEVSHHVASMLGIARTDTALACEGREPHRGWINLSTCDSLAEGFAEFLPTLASLTLDAGRGVGYATPDYAGFGSLESNVDAPWDFLEGADGRVFEYEEFALAGVLWDLVDDTPDEDIDIVLVDATGAAMLLPVADEVSIDGGTLIRLLAAAEPETLVDVYEALLASGDVPDVLKAPDPAFPDLAQAISPIDEVFLMHRFYPVRKEGVDRYHLGDPIARTDRPWGSPPTQVVRYDREPLPGSAIRFGNPGSSPVTYGIDIAYPDTTSHFEVVVAANSEEVVHLELPAYWSGVLSADEELPACGATVAARLVTLTITGPGGVARTIDNCEYQHAILSATEGAALTIGDRVGGAGGVGGGGASTQPMALLIAAGAAVVAVPAVVLWTMRRRRRSLGSPRAPSNRS